MQDPNAALQRLIMNVFVCKNTCSTRNYEFFNTGVTGHNIPPAGIYPGLKRPRLDYTRVYYGLGQFIPQGIL